VPAAVVIAGRTLVGRPPHMVVVCLGTRGWLA